MVDMEEEPREDSGLAGAIRELVNAFRAGEDSTALDPLDRARRMARASGDHDTYVPLQAFQSKQRDRFIRWTSDPKMMAEARESRDGLYQAAIEGH